MLTKTGLQRTGLIVIRYAIHVANPRARKICYWLEMGRKSGREPSIEMHEVMSAVGWEGTAKGDLTANAMTRNRAIAERLGCLDDVGHDYPSVRQGGSYP